jgi:hypothetical protein
MKPLALILVIMLCMPLGGCLMLAAGGGFVAGASAADYGHGSTSKHNK